MQIKDFKLLIWILITFTFLVSAFATYYIYWAFSYVPPEEIVINASLIR